MAKMTYQEMLKHPKWQKKRLEILERDNWECQICHDSESTLVVHHRRYISNVEPWDYPNHLLVTLCEECHEEERTERHETEQALLDALRPLFFASAVQDIAIGFSKLELLHVPEVVASVYSWALSSPEIQRELIDRYFLMLEEKSKRYRERHRDGQPTD